MATRQVRDAAIMEALGILEGAGMLYMTDELREAVMGKLEEDRSRDLHMLLVVNDLPSPQSADEREREAASVVSALKWLSAVERCTATWETLEAAYQRIAMGHGHEVRIIVSMPPRAKND